MLLNTAFPDLKNAAAPPAENIFLLKTCFFFKSDKHFLAIFEIINNTGHHLIRPVLEEGLDVGRY